MSMVAEADINSAAGMQQNAVWLLVLFHVHAQAAALNTILFQQVI